MLAQEPTMVKDSEEEKTWKSRQRSKRRTIRSTRRKALQKEELTIAEMLQRMEVERVGTALTFGHH